MPARLGPKWYAPTQVRTAIFRTAHFGHFLTKTGFFRIFSEKNLFFSGEKHWEYIANVFEGCWGRVRRVSARFRAL